MGFEDLNDALRQSGEDAARARSDNAKSRGNGGQYTLSPEDLLRNTGPEASLRAQPSPDVLPAPSLPMDVAEMFFKGRCFEAGAPTLVHYRGTWFCWKRARWVETADRIVRRWLYRFTQKAKYTTAEGEQRAWAPNRKKIADVHEALQAICPLDDENEQPCWIDGREGGTIVACRNGLLNIEKRSLSMHTPLFFNATFVPFDYEPRVSAPTKWLEFLEAVFPKEPEAIAALQEWFGYVISGQTNLHKILLMPGPTRGGKGAIARVLRALIGPANTAGPTLNSLGETFGLEALLGKSLALISDARFTGKNAAIITERLLSISGEDALSVRRMYKGHWTGRLPCRFHIISNELPRLGDASQAIIGRLILIPMTESWLGKEDITLEPMLHKELPGILNWALDGLARLTANGWRFTRVPSADDAIQTLRDLASPVAAFVREKCKTGKDDQGDDLKIDCDALYLAYRNWCDVNGHPKSPSQHFGRDLRAAFSKIKVERPRGTGSRQRRYIGIDLPAFEEGEEPPEF